MSSLFQFFLGLINLDAFNLDTTTAKHLSISLSFSALLDTKASQAPIHLFSLSSRELQPVTAFTANLIFAIGLQPSASSQPSFDNYLLPLLSPIQSN